MSSGAARAVECGTLGQWPSQWPSRAHGADDSGSEGLAGPQMAAAEHQIIVPLSTQGPLTLSLQRPCCCHLC